MQAFIIRGCPKHKIQDSLIIKPDLKKKNRKGDVNDIKN